MKVVEYQDRDAAVTGVADVVKLALTEALAEFGTASLAVPGGTTPGPVFDRLSHAHLDWSRVTVMLTDERWVPDTHERSNASLVRSRFLQNEAASASFLAFYRSGLSADHAAEGVSADVSKHLPLSVAVLGMGADMHTASLFPNSVGLKAALRADAPAVCPIHTDSQPEPRITLSAQVLNSAHQKHALIFGDEKRAALVASEGMSPQEAPIRAVIDKGVVHWAP
ncbi:MAG: 6-phosphogluconolactonase [Pseudomonadota bacterium]